MKTRRIRLDSLRMFVCGRAGRRASSSLQFAVVGIPFIAMILFVIEISYDLFTQEVLDRSLYLAARKVQTGNAQNVQSGNDFIANYLTPNLAKLLSSSNVYVSIQSLSPSSGQDYYDYTSGSLPMSNGSLDLSGFASSSFCNAAPSQLMLISAIYVGPTIIGSLFTNIASEYYNGSPVHATLSTIGIVTENFAVAAAATGSASTCP